MRQQQPVTSKRMAAKNGKLIFTDSPFAPVMADSLEVMEVYYKERIHTFNDMLDQLNILQDAPEIEFLCREIIEARSILVKIAAKKKYSA